MLISVYLDVDPINILDPLRLFAFVGNSNEAYKWNIKISLIDCKLNTEIQGRQCYYIQHFRTEDKSEPFNIFQLPKVVASISQKPLEQFNLSTTCQAQEHHI